MHLKAKDCKFYHCYCLRERWCYCLFSWNTILTWLLSIQKLYPFVKSLRVRAGRYLGRPFLQTWKNVIKNKAFRSAFWDSARYTLTRNIKLKKKEFLQKFQRVNVKRKFKNRMCQCKGQHWKTDNCTNTI